MSVITFRIRPEAKSPRYYLVRIFETKAEMHEWARRSEHYKHRSTRWFRFEALCTAFDRFKVAESGHASRHPNIGHLLFYAGGFGAGVVAHEISHATVYWAKRHTRMELGALETSPQTDERFAFVLGSMVSQFWQKFYRAKRKARWLR